MEDCQELNHIYSRYISICGVHVDSNISMSPLWMATHYFTKSQDTWEATTMLSISQHPPEVMCPISGVLTAEWVIVSLRATWVLQQSVWCK